MAQRSNCIAVGSKRKKTKPVREGKLGPASSSAAYDVILYQSKQSAQQFQKKERNLSVNKVQRAG